MSHPLHPRGLQPHTFLSVLESTLMGAHIHRLGVQIRKLRLTDVKWHIKGFRGYKSTSEIQGDSWTQGRKGPCV